MYSILAAVKNYFDIILMNFLPKKKSLKRGFLERK